MNEIDILKKNLEKYPNVKFLINGKDIALWEKKLSEFDNPLTDYIQKSIFNLLTSLILAEQFDTSQKLLRLLEDSLTIFTNLKFSTTFKRNIKSLEDYAFFSFLSELSLANYLYGKGFTLNFNTQYVRLKDNKTQPRDIDIEACSKDNQKIYFEVYTPNKQTDINGFFNLPLFGDKFEQKIKNKEYDKFDSIIPGQLNGQIILAINYAYDDNFNIFLKTFGSDFFKKIESATHGEIDGILFYYHDLAKNSVLRFDKIILKLLV